MNPTPEAKIPSHVAAEGGLVIIDGPDGTAVTMSPDAAEETARRLMKAAGEAKRQAADGVPPPQ